MIKGNRINTEVPFRAPIVVYQCWCFCEHENVYNIKANILDKGSEKPKYKHYGIDSKKGKSLKGTLWFSAALAKRVPLEFPSGKSFPLLFWT